MRTKKKKRNISMILTVLFALLSVISILLYSMVWFTRLQQENTSAASLQSALSSHIQHSLSKIEYPAHTKIQDLLDQMTIEEKVGQLFIARCPQEKAIEKINTYHLGGYLLFEQDFSNKSKEQIQHTIQSYQQASSIGLWIGADEEGGTVNRISTNPQLRAVPFWSPQDLYQEGGYELIRSDTKEKCQLLQELGVNLNFAPVCDVSDQPADFIYPRTFGKDANATSTYVQVVIQEMKQQKIGSVLKHFPGYGNNLDTHTGISHDQRPYTTFISNDFLPFQAGINAGADLVLVSHNIVECIDEASPASLSANVHSILRNDLGFTGVIITDDLAMQAIQDCCPKEEIAIRALLAGNDVLCCTDFEEQIQYVLNAVQDGTISEARIDVSLIRVLQCKEQLGILK